MLSLLVLAAVPTVASLQLPPTNSYYSYLASGTGCTFTVSGQAQGNGVYYGQSSSVYSGAGENQVYAAFDGDDSTFVTSSAAYYTGAGNSYTGSAYTTLVGGTKLYGDWLQVQVPQASTLVSFYIVTRAGYTSRFPCYGTMLGSTDGTNWYSIGTFSRSCSIQQLYGTFTLAATSDYTYFRMVPRNLAGDNFMSVATFYVTVNSYPSTSPTSAPTRGPTVAPT